jgi:2-polyprenyl-3-methyl-5-hydroxy-6-metoxy-1,4-benzoquinol methylase
MNRIARGINIFRRRGLRYFRYLLFGYLWPTFSYKCLYEIYRPSLYKYVLILGLGCGILAFTVIVSMIGLFLSILVLFFIGLIILILKLSLKKFTMANMCFYARLLIERNKINDDLFTLFKNLELDPEVKESIENARNNLFGEDLCIGHIDNDGRALGLFGEISGLTNITEGDFVERYRYPLDIVLIRNYVLLRKDFGNDKMNFLREWYNLALLQKVANTPAVFDVDEDRCLLYKNFIIGRTLRDVLVDAGAKILNTQTDNDPELNALENDARLKKILNRGTDLLPSVISDKFLNRMEKQINKIHSVGIVKLSLTFGNIILDKDEQPWFVDFEGSRTYKSYQNPIFNWHRDRDRQKFNSIYNRQVMTETSARATLTQQIYKNPVSYAPIDYGNGLVAGGFWSTDSGTGRWQFFNKSILAPLIRNKRVLDLGSNNGIMPIMMLRDGATEVVGIELNASFVEWAKLNKEILEWRDICNYNFIIHNCNMMDIFKNDWGKFDVATAFASLYYLTEEDMTKVVKQVSKSAPIFVVQAKTDTRPEASNNKAEKSSIRFLQNLLEQNGFPRIVVHAPEGFSRPILVGYTK